jgi:hypothetical protein
MHSPTINKEKKIQEKHKTCPIYNLEIVRERNESSNPEGCSLIGQVLDLLLRGYQFESHKPQDHWRLT